MNLEFKTQQYYEDLVIRYNIENSFYKKINAKTEAILFKQAYAIISDFLEETISMVVEQYEEEFEGLWQGSGDYYLVITPNDFGQSVSVHLEYLCK